MTLQQFIALLPLLLVAVGITWMMLLIAVVRNHRAVAQLTTLGLVLTLIACLIPHGTVEVTPLLIFDPYTRFVMALIAGAGIAVTFLLYGYLSGFDGHREEMYLLLLLATLGALTLAASRHAASLLLGLEILSVSLFGMIAYTFRQRRPLEAGIKYLVLSAAASGALFFGFALIYGATGTLQFEKLGEALGNVQPGLDATLVAIGGALVWVGFGFKLSFVPFHLWTPDVYEGAPAPVTAFLATVSKGAVAALLLRYLDFVTLSQSPGLVDALTVIAIATILLGNFLALMQANVKRLLAYSSIAHFGYLLVPFIVGGEVAREAVLFYLAAYTVMTLGTFGAVSMVSTPYADRDADQLYDYRGLFWRRPFVTSVFTPMLLAQAGVPLTVGFLAKFYVLAAGVDQQAWLLSAVVVLGSAISLYYYLRLAIVQFLPRRSGTDVESVLSEITVTGGFAMAVLFVLLFWWGTWPHKLIGWITPAVAALR